MSKEVLAEIVYGESGVEMRCPVGMTQEQINSLKSALLWELSRDAPRAWDCRHMYAGDLLS